MSRFVDEDIPLVRAAHGEAPALRPASVRPPFPLYLKQLWQRRHFLRKQAWAQAMTQHQDSLLGNLWLIMGPLFDGLVFYLIFGVLFPRSKQGIDNFFGYLIIGIFLFSFTSRSISGATRSISAGRGLIRAFTFPRASLPIAVIVREIIALGPILYVLLILVLIVPPKATLGWHWLMFPVLLMLQTGINLGLGLIFARWGAGFPDVHHIVGYLLRFLMFGSCVMWTIDRFDAFPSPVPEIARNNPFFIVLDSARAILLDNQMPSTDSWLKLTAWAFCSLVVGLIYFWQGEESYARRAHE